MHSLLVDNNWPFVIQTRSPLVLRDMDIIKKGKDCSVGFSIPTANDEIRKKFEPRAPSIIERVNALEELHRCGIRTYAMIAPILPGAMTIMNLLDGKVDFVYVDRLNYSHADAVYKKFALNEYQTGDYFQMVGQDIRAQCIRMKIDCNVLFGQ
ncbi:hypothetical protein JW979_02360 [bacterium]|nr:hypothetical protein [candidate division CSSED10-310 bacterium]